MPDLIPVDHDPFADAAGFFPAFDAAGTRIPMDIDPVSGAPILSNVSQAPLAMQKLFGAPGVERYQTWPEKMIRSAVTLPADAYAGKVPVETRAGFPGAEPEGSRDVLMEPNLLGKALGMSAKWNITSPEGEIGRTQDLSGLAVTGPLAAAKGSATLGAGMTKPETIKIAAIRNNTGKTYTGITHGEAWGKMLGDLKHLSNAEYANLDVDQGFLTSTGRYVGREEAAKIVDYAAQNKNPEVRNDPFQPGLLSEQLKNNGKTLLSDTGKPGSAVSALAHSQQAPAFYSAVEHAINNVRNDKMSPDQWVGYLKNQPGVKAEELAWMGLDDPKNFGAGKKQLTKQEVLDHAKEHGVEIKEVEKTGGEELDPAKVERVVDRNVRDYVREFEESEGRAPTVAEETDLRNTVRQQIQEDPESFELTRHELGATKFSEYQLPGGENYREMLFTLPTKDAPKADVLSVARKMAESQGDDWAALGPNGRQRYEDAARYDLKGKDGNYQSSHWDEPNVLAHVRMNDRDVPGVGKTLHLEELQSDWHQTGRKQGYRDPARTPTPEMEKEIDAAWARSGYPHLNTYNWGSGWSPRQVAQKAFDEGKMTKPDLDLINNYADDLKASDKHSRVPDAPFKTTWPDLVLKRMIREASEKGYDAISWTPGEAQAARYDLSKKIREVHAEKLEGGHLEGQYALTATDHNGREVLNDAYPANKLPDVIGKELAEKIVKDGGGKYSGLDLKVGGEGMKAFYDKMLVDKANAIAKKFGGKVEKQPLAGGSFEIKPVNTGDGTGQIKFEIISSLGDDVSPAQQFKTKHDAEIWIKEHSPDVHILRLPSALKDTATRKGFPLFAAGLPFSFQPVDHDPFAEQPK